MYDNDYSTSGGTDTASCDLEQLNALLRGELSAVETYAKASSRFEGHWATATLEYLRANHEGAAKWLREQIQRAGGEPAVSAEIWDAFKTLHADSDATFCPVTALATLVQGEEYGINAYEEALRNEDLELECKEHIRLRLLPQCQQHIIELDHLMAQHDQAS